MDEPTPIEALETLAKMLDEADVPQEDRIIHISEIQLWEFTKEVTAQQEREKEDKQPPQYSGVGTVRQRLKRGFKG